MKKNIFTVLILAICLVNLVLSAVIIFTVLPTQKRTDKLIAQVASVIDLELMGDSTATVALEDLEQYDIASSKTMNLKIGQDGATHYAVIDGITMYINTKSDDYEKLQPTLESQQSSIMEIVGGVVSKYTYEEASGNTEEIKSEILKKLQQHFASLDFISDITLNNFIFS
ncbi:MAG: flagellar basal body-associated protein FliL [Lachnospiraceae bacterium]|nr:flagellar basal body-associated protein FliL [Lachnospiraceae bacterium]